MPQRRLLTPAPNVSERIPFKDFLQLAAFVASIGISLSLSASLALANASETTPFMGKTDQKTLDDAHDAARSFTWAAAVFGLALALSSSAQLLLTSPRVQALLQPNVNGMFWMRMTVGSISWLSLFLIAAGLLLVSKGLKPIDSRAGAMFQWAIAAVACSLSMFWAMILATYELV